MQQRLREFKRMRNFSGRNVVVLGGAGFIGSNLALRLVEMGANVTLVDAMLDQYGGNLENIAPIKEQVRINFADIRNKKVLSYLLEGAEFIFSMAGQTSHIESMEDPTTDLDINCRSQLSILETCRELKLDATIVYASTRQLYGRPQYLPVDEKHPIQPVDVNGINKLAAEMYYTLYHQVYGLNCVSLRMTNTYGPRQHVSGNKQGFAGIFIRKAISGESIQIFGDGRQLRDFNYIEDVVQAILLSASDPALSGKVFNLGADKHYSLLDFVELLHESCEFQHSVIPFPPEHKVIDIGDYYGSYAAFHAATGWAPKVELREGLRRTVEYFKPRRQLYW